MGWEVEACGGQWGCTFAVGSRGCRRAPEGGRRRGITLPLQCEHGDIWSSWSLGGCALGATPATPEPSVCSWPGLGGCSRAGGWGTPRGLGPQSGASGSVGLAGGNGVGGGNQAAPGISETKTHAVTVGPPAWNRPPFSPREPGAGFACPGPGPLGQDVWSPAVVRTGTSWPSKCLGRRSFLL